VSAGSAIISFPGYRVGTWRLDPPHSDLGFVVRHMMVSKVRGKFLDFEGTIRTADDPLNSSASVTVQMASINTGNERRDNHIRSSDFFEVEKYPVMSFESTGARSDDGDIFVDGELTIRGITRPITLAVEFGGIHRDSKGRLRLGFTASGSLNRQDFGVSWNAAIEAGGMTLGDNVKIEIDIEVVLEK
jgi:polyisoprenoid-binding protein YceI